MRQAVVRDDTAHAVGNHHVAIFEGLLERGANRVAVLSVAQVEVHLAKRGLDHLQPNRCAVQIQGSVGDDTWRDGVDLESERLRLGRTLLHLRHALGYERLVFGGERWRRALGERFWHHRHESRVARRERPPTIRAELGDPSLLGLAPPDALRLVFGHAERLAPGGEGVYGIENSVDEKEARHARMISRRRVVGE